MSQSPTPQPVQPSQSATTQPASPSQSPTSRLRQRLQGLKGLITQHRGSVVLAGCILLLIVTGVLVVIGVLGLVGFSAWYVSLLILLAVLDAIGIIALIRLGYEYEPPIGFKEYTKISTTTETTDPTSSPPQKISRAEEKQPAKTLWDWLQLLAALAIPLVVVGATIGFGWWQAHLADLQHQHDLNIAATRYAEDKQLAQEQQVETNLQTYLDKMSELLLNPNLHNRGQLGDNVRILATAKTVTMLQDLDEPRKAIVLKFLHNAGLITRQDPMHPDIVNPVVNLNGADFSRVDLTGFVLGGADLASVNFTRVTLDGADLSGAYLNQAILRGANLTGAKLDYTQLTGVDLNCAAKDPKTCTNLTKADLSGADFTDANLAGAIFKNTEVTGTNFPHGFAQGLTGGKAFTRTWRIFQQDNILKIAHNDGSLLPTYGQIDLTTSKLQLVYSPSGNFSTSLVLLPVLLSSTSCPTHYCETAPVTVPPLSQIDLRQPTLSIKPISGTIAGLQVSLDVTFSQSSTYPISVVIHATTRGAGNIHLDPNHTDDAFKPVVLRAMRFTATQASRQQAFADNRFVDLPLPVPGNIPPIIHMQAHTFFGLTGGTFGSIMNVPTLKVELQDPTSLQILGEVKQPSSQNDDNVSVWSASPTVLNSWRYKVTASDPNIQKP